MLSLRTLSPLDIPPLAILIQDNWNKYSDDYEQYDPVAVQQLLISPDVRVIDAFGYAVGVVIYASKLDDLHATLFCLLQPKYLRYAVKHNLFNEVLKEGFGLGVGSLLTQAISPQRSVIKFLRKHKFKQYPPKHKRTRKGGVKVDVVEFELRKGYFDKMENLSGTV